ncbi:MAG: hypothetical protein IK038_02300 [Bacteroidaceae bacterium]|nr:hypothetical protein [Bacteroidaceae bacterium]
MDYQQVANNWETYDYREAVNSAAKDAILEIIEYDGENGELPDTLEDMRDKFHDDLWTEDSVTGNGSGSYTFSRMMAELYLVGNSDLYAEALEAFGGKFEEEPEHRDISIRCYLLDEAIDKALEDEEVIEAFKKAKEGK